MKKNTVAIAMSGGVDSSVATYLLLKKGYDVIGITMKIWEEDSECETARIENTRKVAQKFNIPFYVFNLIKEFKENVVDYFCREYANARTPNPCIVCNEKIKFGYLLSKAQQVGASFISTGHYANLKYNKGRYFLKKGKDLQKDQSYLLFSLSQYQLSHIIFPLGELTKDEVRKIAREIGLNSCIEEDSQEICFIPENNYNKFLKKQRPDLLKEGDVITKEGEVLGKHKGISFFTIGQRRKLRIGKGYPLYVINIEKRRNVLVVGKKEDTYARGLIASSINWIGRDNPCQSEICEVKIRYQHKPVPSIIFPLPGGRTKIDFTLPQKAVTPGQAVVFYRGDAVLGGGWIEESISQQS